ncbi:MAG TPA: hypothetical protein VFV38_17795 [Ktedonobacteraceae bacterium]|nr:hypothetical protein [Ktedonobacteraceae bacterium]
MATIRTTTNQWETGLIIETEEGQLEAVIVHLPGSEPTFYLAETALDDDGNAVINELYSCPVPTR